MLQKEENHIVKVILDNFEQTTIKNQPFLKYAKGTVADFEGIVYLTFPKGKKASITYKPDSGKYTTVVYDSDAGTQIENQLTIDESISMIISRLSLVK